MTYHLLLDLLLDLPLLPLHLLRPQDRRTPLHTLPLLVNDLLKHLLNHLFEHLRAIDNNMSGDGGYELVWMYQTREIWGDANPSLYRFLAFRSLYNIA